jgi:hypothetical protein
MTFKRFLTFSIALISFQGFCFYSPPIDTTDDLLSLLGDENPLIYSSATFKSTRIINGQSVDNVAAGCMDFRISHRFGAFNSGPHKLYGLDIANMRLGLEYGVTDRLMVGVGRTNVNEEVDAFGKFKILKQIESGPKKMPITLSYFASTVLRTTEWEVPNRKNFFTSRLYFCHQLLIGRKFNDRLSLQVTPTLVHRNLVPTTNDPHDIFALGYGGRYKITKRLTVNGEYFQVLNNALPTGYYNGAALGVDLETGGHVFQMHITNTNLMNEKGFITETKGKWGKGDIQFGFNISRIFTVYEPRRKQE